MSDKGLNMLDYNSLDLSPPKLVWAKKFMASRRANPLSAYHQIEINPDGARVRLPARLAALVPELATDFTFTLLEGKLSLYLAGGVVTLVNAPHTDICPSNTPFMMNALTESIVVFSNSDLPNKILVTQIEVVR